MKILALVDGSERTGRVLQYLLGLAKTCAPIEVVVLNVQPRPDEWRMRGYGWFKREEIRDRLTNDIGKRIVTVDKRTLDGAGIQSQTRIEIGEQVETITRCADEERADLVIVPERAPGFLRRWLLNTAHLPIGSAASVVLQLVSVPVVAIK
jgi:nucleotide-binding universal stress UspA family protein